jgi:hypothetical protein
MFPMKIAGVAHDIGCTGPKISVARFAYLHGMQLTIRPNSAGANVTLRQGDRSMRFVVEGEAAASASTVLASLAERARSIPEDPLVTKLYAVIGDDLFGELLYETE